MIKNSEGTYWAARQKAHDCARTKFKKNETFTAHKFHEKCGIDYYTATKYLPKIVGKDLGGGKRIISTDVATEGYVLDPPGEGSLEAARSECCRVCGCEKTEKVNAENNSWMGGLGLILSFLIGLVIFAPSATLSSARYGRDFHTSDVRVAN